MKWDLFGYALHAHVNVLYFFIVMSKCNGVLLQCTVELDFAPTKKLQTKKTKNPGNFSIMIDV